MKKQMSYYVKKLEEAGIDTSKFNLELNGVVMSVDELLESNNIVENIYIFNRTNFEKDIALQTLKAMKSVSNENYKNGINAFIREKLNNSVQFRDLLNIAKILADLEKFTDSEEYKILASIYTFGVYEDFLNDYTERCKHFHYLYGNNRNKYTEACFAAETILYGFSQIDNYKKLYDVFKNFGSVFVPFDKEEAKCPSWKEAFKACSSYFTLSYLIKKGTFKVFDLNMLNAMFNGLVEQGQAWRLYLTLENNKDNIEELK